MKTSSLLVAWSMEALLSVVSTRRTLFFSLRALIFNVQHVKIVTIKNLFSNKGIVHQFKNNLLAMPMIFCSKKHKTSLWPYHLYNTIYHNIAFLQQFMKLVLS